MSLPILYDNTVHQLISLDIRNNSAWNQRWFVMHHRPALLNHQNPATTTNTSFVTPEMKYALRMIQKDPYNESPWTYVLALLREKLLQEKTDASSSSSNASLLQEFWDQIHAPMEQILTDAGHDPNGCAPWASARIHVLELLGDVTSLDMVCL